MFHQRRRLSFLVRRLQQVKPPRQVTRLCRLHRHRLLFTKSPEDIRYSSNNGDEICSLRCLTMNARSLNNKLPEFYHLIYATKYDVILVTESWLNSDTPSGLIDPDCRYNIIRCDRKERIGGGVCVLISKELQYSEVCNCNFRNAYELCCFDIIYSANRFRLFSIYRKPGFAADSIDGMLSLVNCLSAYINVSYPCIVTGDLNCSHVDWKNLNARADGINDTFLNFAVTNSFNQLVDIPTRGKKHS